MKVLIVDDEAPARRRLARMVADIDGMRVAAAVADTVAAREALAEHRPDVVLLDIQMPEEDGLHFAASAALPAVIFVTAHDEHAVRAFELAAVDYVLKPVSRARLQAALARAARQKTTPQELAAALREAIEARAAPTPRVTARSGDTWRVFAAPEIACFVARDKVTTFEHDGAEFILDHSLGTLQDRLEGHEFFRAHRGVLVNLAFVVALHAIERGHELELRGGTRVAVSRRAVSDLKRRLGI